MSAEPVSSVSDRAGSDVQGALEAPLTRVMEWAGASRCAVILSGSHAAGEAVWAECGGRRVSLSDLDVYAVIGTAAERDAAEARARSARGGLSAWLIERGFAGPLEVAFHTPAQFERLPPRPGTLELRRHARVIEGDPAFGERVPAWRPADIPAEEVNLLLENRGQELLLAHPGVDADAPLDRLRSRHAVLKVALDLAAIAALGVGEFPDGARARVEWVRARGGARMILPAAPEWPGVALAADPLERLWDEALAWRSGVVGAPDPERALADWSATVAAWCATWWARSSQGPDAAADEPFARVCRFASRARPRRRAREALTFRARSGAPPSLWNRLRHAARGTPGHRVNGSATVLLLSAALHGTATLAPAAAAALDRLGVASPGARDWAAARAEVTRRWDLWILEGLRTGGMA